MQRRKNKEIKLIFTVLAVFFLAFLAVPMVQVIVKSLTRIQRESVWKITGKFLQARDLCRR